MVNHNVRTAVYTGSFDPITLGHLNIIERASTLVDRLVVGIGVNVGKNPLFSLAERVELVRETTRPFSNVEVIEFTGLAVNFVRECGARVMIRGVRPLQDLEAELTMMLAEAAVSIEEGPLADFTMSEADRYELKIAGLLHDCGKITTPVHVVDKATKLETLFDRIHLVDARIEILLRDAQIAHLKGEIDAAALAARTQQLQADREFLRRANIGGEFMSDGDIAQVQRIASQAWNDLDGSPRTLLSDEEAMNLSIRRGTLNAAEREVINNHIVMTIRMLEALPWPPHLRNVPEYAGGHHERMDGKGYPRGLKREQMSVQARVMGIADVFEALTAPDRPYKSAKTLSESIHILGNMKLGNHIDPDLFDVFLRERVYLRYAQRFLDPKQIDTIDWHRVPGVSAELAAFLSASEAQE